MDEPSSLVFSPAVLTIPDTLDTFNNLCYKCNANQYWDAFNVDGAKCSNCPQFATCCKIDDFGFLSICGCQSGYSIDSFNNICYSCTATQYYDPLSAQCFACPAGSSCCKYADGFLTICACSSGFTLDTVNQVCYSCTSTQYYNSAVAACTSCPSCATTCFVRNGQLQVGGTTRGQSFDTFNQICYASCLTNQYYDPLQLSCQSCPFCATSCTYDVTNGRFTVPGTISGYKWNSTSQLCYCNDGQYLTFDGIRSKKFKAHHEKTPKLTYAGQIGAPETFDLSLGSTSESTEVSHDKYLFGTTTTLNAGAYADKYSLYPWTYKLESNDRSFLDVTAHSMWGLNQDYCGYFEAISEELQVEANTHMPTFLEDSSHPCGHYVVFTADSEEGSITFSHLTTGGVINVVGLALSVVLTIFNM